jgi:hypothetical protein
MLAIVACDNVSPSRIQQDFGTVSAVRVAVIVVATAEAIAVIAPYHFPRCFSIQKLGYQYTNFLQFLISSFLQRLRPSIIQFTQGSYSRSLPLLGSSSGIS